MTKHKDRIFYRGGERNPLYLYGLAIGYGWYPLVEELADKLAEWDVDNRIKFVQIKEKLGGLRFYTEIENYNCDNDREFWEQERKIISKYEQKAAVTCERCGMLGKIRPDIRWRKTLCDEHYEEFKKGRE